MLKDGDVIVELRAATTATCGGKAGPLGHLMRAGMPVPDGFVVLPGAPDDATALAALIGPTLAGWGDVAVAVRSSASSEDMADASAAGQHDSFLGVRGVRAVAAAVLACRASLWSERAVGYRRARAAGSPEPVMAVLVQRLVDAEVAGVAFTGGSVRVEAAWGLGESVVHGLVTPDAWTVGPTGVTAHAVGDKPVRVDRATTSGTVRTPVADRDRHRACLTDAEVRRVAATARAVEATLGMPVDVEWALTRDGIRVLQARPVTAPPPPPAPPPATRHAPAAATTTLTGTPGSPGTATGPARVLRGPGGPAGPGDIIVCRSTDPAWTPLFTIAAAFVTETGGVLSHAAIVAREHRIPAVLGVPGAMSAIRDGQIVTVHGEQGLVLT
jgi:pyruvate,water dikinase